MPSGARGPRPSSGERRGELDLYEVSILFPLVTGGSALTGGIALALGSGHRMPWTGITYFAALALLIGGAVAYFAIGLWLLPASMVVGGTVLFAANQSLVYLGPWSLVVAAPFLILGGVATVSGLSHLRTASAESGETP